MRIMIMVLLILTAIGIAVPKQQFVLPYAPDLIPQAVDSLPLSGTEVGIALDDSTYGAVILRVVNPTTSPLLIRYDTEASPDFEYIGAYGTGPLWPDFIFPEPQDSLFLKTYDAAACTVFVCWWGVEK